MKAKVIIFSNQKGGVGKSTLSRELGSYMAREGYKTLLIDCDAQGNLTKGLLNSTGDVLPGLYEALSGDGVKPHSVKEGLDLLAGDSRLAALEKSLVGEADSFLRLKDLLELKTFDKYQIIILDTPPSLGVLTIGGLAVASHLVIPVNAALYSLHGTNTLMKTISKIKRGLNLDLKLLGVIINNYDTRPLIHQEVRAEIKWAFGDVLFKHYLSRSIKIEEAIAAREGVAYLDSFRGSKTRREVEQLGEEFKTRLGL